MRLQSIKKYAEAYRVQWKNNWVREAVYRTNFLTTLVVDIVWIAVEFSLFTVIYANVPTLAGWTKPQTFFFLGMFFSSDAIFTTLFQRNFWTFSDLVNKGELDILLTKPIHPLFLALTRSISISTLFNLALGLAIMVRYAEPAGFSGGFKWFLVAGWLGIGVYTAIVVRFAFAIWIFWTERSWAISRMYYQFFSLATKPDTLYPRAVRTIILTALPFAFIGSVPARALLHGLQSHEYIWLVSVLTGFTLLNIMLWKKGLRRYQSASS